MSAFNAAKELDITMFLVGHVTKNGNIAGPRVLEHLVDALLLLEGDEQHQYRLLRAVKNRFGSTNEVGIFEMTGSGVKEVANPSEYLIGQQQIREHRARQELEPALACSNIFLNDVRAGNVRGHQIGSELDAAETQLQGRGQ